MKRLFILASAAIIAFASCAKTHVVYNEEPQEIGFKTVNGVMTKAVAQTLGNPANETMGVVAYRESTGYFPNTSFYYDSASDAWTGGDDPKYWPVSGNLIFTIYSPYDSDVVVSENTVKIEADNSINETDWLYGIQRYEFGRSDNAHAVTLAHALSLVEINVKGNTNVTLKGIELCNTYQIGTGTITYAVASPYHMASVGWDLTSQVSTLSLYTPTDDENGDVLSTPKTVKHLVIPTNPLSTEQIKLTYRLTGSNVDLTHTIITGELGTAQFEIGKKYIYNIEITPAEIMFNPSVRDWDLNTDIDGTTDSDADDKDFSL